jgi:hypothetical protein
MSNLMKIRPNENLVVPRGQTDRTKNDEANSRFSQFLRTRLKTVKYPVKI